MKKITHVALNTLDYIVPVVLFSMAYFFDIQSDFSVDGSAAASETFGVLVTAWLLAVIPIAAYMTRYSGLKVSGSQLYYLHLVMGALVSLITLGMFMATINQYYFGFAVIFFLTVLMKHLLNKYAILKPNRKWYQ